MRRWWKLSQDPFLQRKFPSFKKKNNKRLNKDSTETRRDETRREEKRKTRARKNTETVKFVNGDLGEYSIDPV
ncbi:hypothetical protein POVWA1_014130 [Plasmodium ovale wallikeri]|uniref:Uncharacterized protein n=1 Tax=Plasmodium ovale wallikeri TaxID=864142 RepID=A0A1A8YMQ3_PLAOA|nr:hypothetical protein POVWA1_014130 [Plasmodium ovale wallikeri]